MILYIALLCLATAVFLLGEVASAPARERQRSMRRAADYGKIELPTGAERLMFRERVVIPAANRLAALVLRFNPRTSIEAVSLKLMSAGLSQRITPTAFLAAKAAGAALGLIIGFMLGLSFGPIGAIFFTIALAVGGFAVPGILVSGRAKSRREKIRAGLPDALDLLAVSVEAGLGFDGALAQLTEHMDGPLPEEFALTLNEMRIGKSRHDALKMFSERVDTSEVSAFTRAIIQADQLGISLGRILRLQATDTRLRRQAAAEEKAMKAPIKMLFPTVMFIFPVMFIVILGPVALSLSKVF